MIGAEARGAWRELERHLRPYLARRVASPADVDDLLQDVFERMHQSLGSLRDDERFGAWVYRIANSAVVDSARRKARSPRVEPQDLSAASASPVDESEELEDYLGECVALFVGQLPSPYREAITLTELEGLSHKQAAEMLDISLSGIKSRVQRGREKIRQMFLDCCRISVDCRGRIMECEPRAAADARRDCGSGQRTGR